MGIAIDEGCIALKEKMLVMLKSAGQKIVDFGEALLMPDDNHPACVVPLGYQAAAEALSSALKVCAFVFGQHKN